MIAFLKSVDGRIIDAIQQAYLWIYDRTGVRVGTCVFAAMAMDIACFRMLEGFRAIDAVFLLFLSTGAAARYYLQAKDLRRFNIEQMAFRQSILRLFGLVLVAVLTIEHVFLVHVWRLASDLFWFVWLTLFCILVRDREPKDFFQRHQMAGSHA